MEKLIIFARAPRAGEVKTRLAAEVGKEAALEIYRELLSRVFSNLKQIREAEVAYAPADSEPEVKPLVPGGWRLRPQIEGGLDARLVEAFENAFAQGATKVAVIGSDCPAVMAGHIRQAFSGLKQADAVFGPATDGGYWLVALKAPHPELFQDIPWSSSEVLAKSLANARRLKLKIDLLEILSDIDTQADWKEYQRQQGRP